MGKGHAISKTSEDYLGKVITVSDFMETVVRCKLRTGGGATSQTLECNSFVLVYIHLEELYFLNTNNNINYA